MNINFLIIDEIYICTINQYKYTRIYKVNIFQHLNYLYMYCTNKIEYKISIIYNTIS